jgi:tetratricopeptide (TPR) repeat protein
LLYERGIYPKSTYVFKHALTQEVAYNGLLSKRRMEIHQKIAETIGQFYSERLEEYYELLAYHYTRSENKEKGVEYLVLANQKATRTSSVEEAKAYFDECMNLLDTMPDTEKNLEHRVSLLGPSYILFQLLLQTSEYHELLTRYEPLVAAIDSPHLAGSFYAGLAWCEVILGLCDAAIEHSQRGAELCERAKDAEGAARALSALQVTHILKGDLERAVSLKEEVLPKLDERVTPRRAHALMVMASLAFAFLGRWDEAVKEGRKALRHAEEYSDDSLLSLAACYICNAYTFMGDLDRAIEYGELAVREAPTPSDKATSEGALAGAICRAGEWEKGVQRLAQLVQAFRDSRFVTYAILFMPRLAEGYFLAGEYDRARQTAIETLELAKRCGAKLFLGCGHRLLGEIDIETNTDEAAPHFEKAISIFQDIKAENELALAYSGMGRFHKVQGNTEEAREYLSNALKIFERLGTLIEPDKVREEMSDLPETC